jgi:UDP-N-acetylglucosamine--N-acetylmuramyl-(pentapeptide) pyrophosphoryl-undecaprenol N-acetylglucosamine transferase
LPRKPSAELLRLPLKVRAAINQTRAVLDRVQADVVIGFGGYVALPAYFAARGRVPIIVHETNARPGLANRVGARFAAKVATAGPDIELPHAQAIGIPLRDSITTLDRAALREKAREHFGLDKDAPTLLVFGGSQGARSINSAAASAAGELAAAGIGVLHAHGPKNSVAVQEVPGAPAYVTTPYLERMDLAYAAADAVLCRCGAMTVAEVSALGMPAVYVPLPHGNGEQALNARPAVRAGAAVEVADGELTAEKVRELVIPMLTEPDRLAQMSAATQLGGHRDAAEKLARMAIEVSGK